MANKQTYLAKNVVLFSISGFVPKILTVILVPLYTNFLTTAEYGVSDLINTTVSMLIPVFTVDIQDAVMRFAMDSKYDRKDVFTVAIRIILAGTAVVGLGAFLLSLFNISGLKNRYLFFFFAMYFANALNRSVSLFCRGIDKVNVMVVASIMESALTLGFNILFLVVFNWGLSGFLLANLIGSIAGLTCCFVGAKLYRYIGVSVSDGVCKDMVGFSIPLVFSTMAWWVNSASDRYILSWISGVAVSGLYAVSYKIPSILSVFQNVLSQAWSISAVKDYDPKDSDGFISRMYNMMNTAMMILCSGIMLFNIPIAKILYSKDFFNAWRCVPPLLLSVVFNGMALFIGSIFTAVKDTKTLSTSTVIGAAVNTACNFLFIYLWGAYGAALATLIGYAVVLIIRHIILRKHIILKIRWKRDILAYTLLLAQMVVAFWGKEAVLIQIAVFLALIFIYKNEIRNVFLQMKTLAEKTVLNKQV